jgi:DNA ligase-1
MKVKTFKPQKAPNEETNLDEIKYPLLASYKLDGLRDIYKQGQMLTCSLKKFPNKQVNEKFEAIRKYSEENNLILDGELYAHRIPFQMIVSCAMTHDYYTKSSIKKWEKLCKEYSLNIKREEVLEKLSFNCFDCIIKEDFNLKFRYRLGNVEYYATKQSLISPVKHVLVNSKEEVEKLFEQALEEGYEGLVLRNLESGYKFGRGTIKEGIIYKVKPFVTLDAKIIGVVQATEVDENAEKKINELGYSVTSKKQGDRILVERACAVWVKYNESDLKVNLAMTNEQKEEVWKNKESYIGKWIEYKGMLVGSKTVPRHPEFIRWREDKE